MFSALFFFFLGDKDNSFLLGLSLFGCNCTFRGGLSFDLDF